MTSHNHKFSKGDIVILLGPRANNYYKHEKQIILKLMAGATGTVLRAQKESYGSGSTYNVQFKTSNKKGQPVEVTFQVYEEELDLAFKI